MTEFILHRFEDPSNVSGTGAVAWGVEWPDGAVAVRWPGEHPSTAVWPEIRDVEAIHGHGGKTLVQYVEPKRLVQAYAQVMFWLLGSAIDDRPMSVGPHPDWPDRLLVRFRDDRSWRLWIALMDGSTHASTHTQDGAEWVHSWTSHDGNVWLQHRTADFDIESVLPGNEYPDNNPYDDRD